MKALFVCILLLAVCAMAWAYQTHRDMSSLQKQCADLMTANESLESKNDTLKTDAKTLNDEVSQLKSENDILKTNTKTLNDEIAQLNDEITKLKNAPPVTTNQTTNPPATSISTQLDLGRLFK